ncbi:hypothetical protein WJX72_003577 [[Myrmecia] bisecta]|uniref:Rhodanese domain-containing protein n=1 Tax=[Myrmecia] bisecta TaxID=41462 RepID=A0AAW1Q6X7_9CHLO
MAPTIHRAKAIRLGPATPSPAPSPSMATISMATAAETKLISKYFGGLASAARSIGSTQHNQSQEDVIYRLFSGIGKRFLGDAERECPVMEVQQAVQKLQDPAFVFVDVREADEMAGKMGVPGAISLPLSSGSLDSLLTHGPNRQATELADKSKTVVLYCNNGNRSAAASKAFRSLGFRNVATLSGFSAWMDAKAPVAPISIHSPVVQSALKV